MEAKSISMVSSWFQVWLQLGHVVSCSVSYSMLSLPVCVLWVEGDKDYATHSWVITRIWGLCFTRKSLASGLSFMAGRPLTFSQISLHGLG